MSKSNSWENGLLLNLFNNTAFANVGDVTGLRGSSAAGSLYWSLHTADPGEAGSQTTNECAYTSYARVAGARSSGGFTVTGNSVSPAATVSFPAATGGSETASHFGVGTDSSGAGTLLYSGPLGTNLGAFTALASNDTLTIPGITGVSVNDNISFYAVNAQTLPVGITSGTLYFVKTVSGTAVTLSATSGGATLDITADGEGYAFRNVTIPIAAPVQPQITTSTVITED